jgi:TldD protein
MNQTVYDLAAQRLLHAQGLTLDSLEHALSAAMGPGVNAADLYFQFSRQENWGLEDGIVKEGSHSIEQGVGVRAISGEKVGFAYSDELSVEALAHAASAARAIARTGQSGRLHAWEKKSAPAQYGALDPIDSLDAASKVSLLRELDAYARSLDPRVVQVMAGVSASMDTVLIAASDGTLAGDVRPLIHLRVTVIAEQNGRP